MKRSAIPVQCTSTSVQYSFFTGHLLPLAMPFPGWEMKQMCVHTVQQKKKYSLRSTVNWPNRRVTPGDSQAQQKELVKERSLALRRQTFTTQQHSFHYNFSDKKTFVNSSRQLVVQLNFPVHTFWVLSKPAFQPLTWPAVQNSSLQQRNFVQWYRVVAKG